MDSRERTLRTLSFEEPDRVPVDLWLSQGFWKKLGHTGNDAQAAFLDRHDIDLRYIEGPAYIGPALKKFDDGRDEDIWGVIRQSVVTPVSGGSETYKEVSVSPLENAQSVDEIHDYAHWPSPDWFDYSGIEQQCDAIRNAGRAVVFMGDRMNRLAQLKPAMYVRGVSQILMDMAMNPKIAQAVFEHIRGFYCAYAERIFEAANGKLDLLLMGDDFGAQTGLLVSNDMWIEFIGQGFADYIALAKSYGVAVMHHTCGSVRPLIPLMIERGLDILQSLQPEAADMDPRSLKSDFGDRLAFHGGLSIQQTLPFGSVDDVRRQVQNAIETLAPGGGYILSTAHNIQADTPIENMEAMLTAAREFGTYT